MTTTENEPVLTPRTMFDYRHPIAARGTPPKFKTIKRLYKQMTWGLSATSKEVMQIVWRANGLIAFQPMHPTKGVRRTRTKPIIVEDKRPCREIRVEDRLNNWQRSQWAKSGYPKAQLNPDKPGDMPQCPPAFLQLKRTGPRTVAELVASLPTSSEPSSSASSD